MLHSLLHELRGGWGVDQVEQQMSRGYFVVVNLWQSLFVRMHAERRTVDDNRMRRNELRASLEIVCVPVFADDFVRQMQQIGASECRRTSRSAVADNQYAVMMRQQERFDSIGKALCIGVVSRQPVAVDAHSVYRADASGGFGQLVAEGDDRQFVRQRHIETVQILPLQQRLKLVDGCEIVKFVVAFYVFLLKHSVEVSL